MRTLAVMKRILRGLHRDKRTVALVLVAPIGVLGLLSLIFDSADYRPKIAVVAAPDAFVAALETAGARLTKGAADPHALLAALEIDAILKVTGMPPAIELTVEGSDPAVTRATLQTLTRAGANVMPVKMLEPNVTFLHGKKDMATFDNFGPVLIGFLVFFFTFIVSGMSFVRERTTGTLERTLATPIRRHEVVLGYVLGFVVIVAVQATLIVTFSVTVLNMMLVGSFVWLLVIVLLLAIDALTLGMLLSAFARSEFQMVQFIPLVVVPQVFFSGLFPTETLSAPLIALGKLFPLTYGQHAMRQVMIRGGGLDDIWQDLVALALIAAVFLLLNVVALKKYRRL
jgi:ABC-2 type transport system permease protein